MALYPQTTCFYKAVIHEPPSRVSKCLSELKESHLTYNLHSSDKMIGLPQVSETAVNFGLAQEKKKILRREERKIIYGQGILKFFEDWFASQLTTILCLSVCVTDLGIYQDVAFRNTSVFYFRSHDSLKMTTQCRLRTLLTLMVSLHLSMCHSAMSWLPKKRRKDSSDNTTWKTLKEMLCSLILLSGDSWTCKNYKPFKNFSLDPGLNRSRSLSSSHHLSCSATEKLDNDKNH